MIRTLIQSARAARVLLLSVLTLPISACTVYGPSAEHPVGDAEYVSLPRRENAPGLSADHELRIPSFEVLSSQRSVYRIANLPPEQWHITLRLDEPSDAKLDAIDAADVRVKISLLNHNTGAITTKEGRLLGDWGLTLESWAGKPVIYEAMGFRSHRNEVYDLTIEVIAAKPATNPSVTATVRLTSDPR